MQDYSYICVQVLVLTNTRITPYSHYLKQLKNASGHFPESIFLLKAEYNTFFASCLFRFASVKFAITGFLRRISKVKTVNIEH